MAKNWTLKEAVEVIAEGKDVDSIIDIGRRFPYLSHKITKLTTLAKEDFVDLMNYMPEYITANKINSAIKSSISTEAYEQGENNEDEVKAPYTVEQAKAGEVDFTKLSAKEMVALLKEAGKEDKIESRRKPALVELCGKIFGGEDEVEDDEAENPYEGKNAMELYKECKKRKLKVEPKKKAAFYVDILMKDDAAKAMPEPEDEDDDWGDEEEAEEKVEEKPKRGRGRKKKEEPKEEVVEDDDDEWDI